MSKNNENKKSNQKTTMKKVLKRIKPYSFLVICSLVMAAATVVLAPIIIIFIFANKKLMGNLTVGGVKG